MRWGDAVFEDISWVDWEGRERGITEVRVHTREGALLGLLSHSWLLVLLRVIEKLRRGVEESRHLRCSNYSYMHCMRQ